ncbi:MAG: DUF2062 domain-containing protein [Terracidiphilus sp.]|jgi:uncharacterized protein (DUF2062 family)
MAVKSLETLKRWAANWLRQGISPQRLALTLSLGFAIGCVPVVGIPTLLCAGLALALRLNLPAIQAANYLAMPLQLLLVVPFVKLGGWLFDAGPIHSAQIKALLHTSPLDVVTQLTGMFGHALAAWLLIAVPTVVLLTWLLTVVLRKVPALEPAQAGD